MTITMRMATYEGQQGRCERTWETWKTRSTARPAFFAITPDPVAPQPCQMVERQALAPSRHSTRCLFMAAERVAIRAIRHGSILWVKCSRKRCNTMPITARHLCPATRQSLLLTAVPACRGRYGNAVCRPLNALAISSSTLSYDGQAASPFGSLPGSNAGLDFFVNKIGQAEGIHGTARSVGSVPGNDEKSCSAKTVQQLSDVRGICPEAPALEGSYQIAGVALYGNTKPIRDLGSHRPTDLDKVEIALKVKTMAVSLSGGAPRIDVPVPAPPVADSTANPSDPLSLLSPRRYITITPESVHSGGKPNAPLVFASISSSPTHGAFLVAWNDQFLAADYDMDVVGFLRYDLIRNVNSPSGWDFRVRTDI